MVEQHVRVPKDGNHNVSMVPHETLCLHKTLANQHIINVLSDEAAGARCKQFYRAEYI